MRCDAACTHGCEQNRARNDGCKQPPRVESYSVVLRRMSLTRLYHSIRPIADFQLAATNGREAPTELWVGAPQLFALPVLSSINEKSSPRLRDGPRSALRLWQLRSAAVAARPAWLLATSPPNSVKRAAPRASPGPARTPAMRVVSALRRVWLPARARALGRGSATIVQPPVAS